MQRKRSYSGFDQIEIFSPITRQPKNWRNRRLFLQKTKFEDSASQIIFVLSDPFLGPLFMTQTLNFVFRPSLLFLRYVAYTHLPYTAVRQMGKTDNVQALRLLEIFLAGYREAAATVESVGGKAAVLPIYPLASSLEEASTAQAQIQQTLEECRRVALGIKSLPKEEQEVARVELQKNVKHLLTWCDAISDQARTQLEPGGSASGKRQKVKVEKKEDTHGKVPPQTEKV